MNALLLAWMLSAAPPLEGAQRPLFSRPEPHLKEGAALLRQGDADGALAAFRRAQTRSADERAVIEFDVGQALVHKAQADAQAAPEADGGPQRIDVTDARAAFERAFGLASDPGLKSEAQLAAGNAAALGGDLDAAIAAYRKALVADPKNERAKKNLLRVLAAKKAQPPPPPNEGGDGEQKDGDKNEEQKDQGQKNGEQKDEDKKDETQKDADKKDEDRGAQQGEEDKDQKKESEPHDSAQSDPQDQKEPQPGEKKEPPPSKPDQKKEDARKLLDALRSREKPLTPMEMRGVTRSRPKAGKDW